MKIKRISCSQFAGVQNRDVSLVPGLNIIQGKNESGKSTMANLLAELLFRPVKLHKKMDKDFIDTYFPSAILGGGTAGDFVDGKVTIETDKGEFVLSKDWGSDARCTLSTPAGIIRDQVLIDKALADILQYGEGVYSGMLFSSQRGSDDSLRTILEAAQGEGVKKDLANAITMAFSESNGVSVETIEQAILHKIEDIEGQHWDRGAKQPKKKADRWSKGLGDILKAYYALEDAQNTLEELDRLEHEMDQASQMYADQDKRVQGAEAAYKEFQRVASRLESRATQVQLAETLKAELNRRQFAFQQWPKLETDITKAKALKAELEQATRVEKYASAKRIGDELKRTMAEVDAIKGPSEEELALAQECERDIRRLESQLGGMNIALDVEMTNGTPFEMRSVSSGATMDIHKPISEAVIINIPGVMQLRLAPADVDIADVQTTLWERKETLKNLMDKYHTKYAKSAAGLEELLKSALDQQAKIDSLQEQLDKVLDCEELSVLEVAARAGASRSIGNIQLEIVDLCGGIEPERLITVNETVIDGYKREYGSLAQMGQKLAALRSELAQAEKALDDLGTIPSEFAEVQNPAIHLAMLDSELKKQQKMKEEAAQVKAAAQTRLSACTEQMDGNPVETKHIAEQNFQEQVELLDKWLHILEVFQTQKQALSEHPMQDVADKFAENLRTITGGSVNTVFEDPDAMEMTVYSQSRQLSYNTLSEGTKEVVSLAFRLAVLDHLFPNGGGVIIFDDPIADMDSDRVAASCKLLTQAAERHQVIFLTCREEYLSMLDGNLIKFK